MQPRGLYVLSSGERKKSPLPDFRFYTIGGLYKKAEKYVLFSAVFLFPSLLLFLAG